MITWNDPDCSSIDRRRSEMPAKSRSPSRNGSIPTRRRKPTLCSFRRFVARRPQPTSRIGSSKDCRPARRVKAETRRTSAATGGAQNRINRESHFRRPSSRASSRIAPAAAASDRCRDVGSVGSTPPPS